MATASLTTGGAMALRNIAPRHACDAKSRLKRRGAAILGGAAALWGPGMSKARQWIAAGRAASPALLALAVAACQIPDFNQMYTPKLDLSTLAPADPTQFARKERSITPVGANDLVDAAG